MSLNPKRAKTLVLVYQIGSLGDTVVSVPSYRAVRRHFGPDADIRVLHNAPRDSRAVPHQVLEGSGLVNGSVTFEQFSGRSTWKTWIQLWSKLRALKADAIVYVAPGERSPSSVRRDRLFFRLCGIPQRIGFHAVDPAVFDTRDAAGRLSTIPHEAIMRLDRLEQDGIEERRSSDMGLPLLAVPIHESDEARLWLEGKCRSEKMQVAVCPGANQSAKFWPIERFEEIGRRLISLGMEIIIIGGPAEKEAGDRLVSAWGQGINAAGQFSVIGSAALISKCCLLLGLDTGTTHLAAALGVPCVALYADRDAPGQWEPLGESHLVLRHPMPCGGCGVDLCPVPGHPCMTGIHVDQVWAAVQEILGRVS